MVYNQIWLNCLLDDCYSRYIAKLGKCKKKTSWCVKHVGGKITLISNYDRYDTTNILH